MKKVIISILVILLLVIGIVIGIHFAEKYILINSNTTIREAIGDLPELKAEKGKNIDNCNPLHKVPLLDDKKIWWLSNTPEGATAFNNQCVNPECLYNGNTLHGAKHNKEGINKANSDTPLYCEKCGSLLPRPYVEGKDGEFYEISVLNDWTKDPQ